MLTNNSTQEVTMKINFVDGTFTNDQRQNRACLDEVTKENFGQYITTYDELVTLSGGESKQEMAQLMYPQWSDGQYRGCITYSVVNMPSSGSLWESTNFSILMRKAKFIDVLVGHPEKTSGGIIFKEFATTWAENLSPNPKIRIYQDPGDNKYIIELTVQNIWWAEENVVITWVASNFLTYKDTFVETRKMTKGQEFIITKKLDSIPNYNLHVDVQLSHTPIIVGIPDLVPQTSYIHESASIIILNIITYITSAGVLLILIILILLIKSMTRRKKQISWAPLGVWTPPNIPTPTQTLG